MAALAEQCCGQVRLAEEPPFALGRLTVTPALRQVEWPGQQRTVEPRVMQVLVALGRAPGAIVSRDALVARCWGGRAVGENAIQRTISLLRALASESGAFRIETITRVGYRLLPDAGRSEPPGIQPVPPAAPSLGRRQLVAGTALLAAGAAGLFGLAREGPARREARRLHAAGVEVQRRGGPDAFRQAARYFERAVTADPELAEAWGDLAWARLEQLRNAHEATHPQLLAAIDSAAAAALRRDPRQRAALLTRALVRSPFRDWTAAEQRVRQTLVQLPEEPLLHRRLGTIFADGGRWRAAAAQFARVAKREPLLPDHQRALAWARWHAGDRDRAEAILDRAAALWPNEIWVWLLRFDLRLLSGRGGEALRMTDRLAVGLGGVSPLTAAVATSVARAVDRPTRAHVAAAGAAIRDGRRKGEIASFIAIPYLSALGLHAQAWEVAETYLLGPADPAAGGRRRLAPGVWRRTDFLFTGATGAMRADSRFPPLTAAIGLDAYWRATRSRPDITAA
jgi:DNA-binding winged helix-turn-helix (wHTH) protein/tetratricopeptide (TPR) repeat protein